MIDFKRPAAPVGILMALALLTGCSQSEPDTRQASVLGTRACVQNFSSTVPTVTFSIKDTARGEGQVQRGSRACGEGSTGGLAMDVKGRIDLPGNFPRSLELFAQNPWIGAPMAYLKQVGGNAFYCTSFKGMDVNDVRVWDDGVLRFVVTRLADGQWKEFTIDLYDSQSPSPDGKPIDCQIGESD